MNLEDYDYFKFRSEKGVLFVTIDNPDVNLVALKIATELLRLSDDVTKGGYNQVVVFDSANPDFLSQISTLETWFNSRMKR